MDSLRPKERRFVEEYLIDLNATQAAVRAGYAPNSADVTASRLLAKARVSAAVVAGQAKRSKRTEITQDRVLQELASIGYSDVRCLFENGRLRDVETLDESIAPAVASIEVTRERTRRDGDVTVEEAVTKIKVWDKVKALELMGRHLGMWNDRAAGDDVEPLKIEVTHRRATPSNAG